MERFGEVRQLTRQRAREAETFPVRRSGAGGTVAVTLWHLARSLKDAFADAGIAPPADAKNREPARPAPTRAKTSQPDGGADTRDGARPPGKRPIAPMPIGVDEIKPGIVVRLDPKVLLADNRVCHTQDPPVSRAGQFVCVAIEAETSTWAGLTTQPRKERLGLRGEWRSGGYKRWRFVDQYLTDGASVWHGPNDVFAAASWQEVSATGGRNRARLSEEGLEAVRTEIELQRHRRHRSFAD